MAKYLPSVLWHCWLGSRKGIRPVKMGGWWRWALVSLDGVAPSQVYESASVGLPLHRKVQKFSSGTGSPGWSWKKGRKMVVYVCFVWLNNTLWENLCDAFDLRSSITHNPPNCRYLHLWCTVRLMQQIVQCSSIANLCMLGINHVVWRLGSLGRTRGRQNDMIRKIVDICVVKWQ